MNETPRYQPLSPPGLAVAFAALAVLGSLSMGMPFMFGMGSMMGGPYGGPGYGHMGWGFGFGLFGLIWFVGIAALGGAIVAWVYNAVIATRAAHPADSSGKPIPPAATHS